MPFPPCIGRVTRWLATGLLLGTCALALALPTPQDIETAVNAGQFAQAETLLREVLKDKPTSARAHYELGQVLAREAKYDAALAEVQRAQSIDSTLKFAASPEKFQQTLDKITAATKLPPPKAATATAPGGVAATAAPAPRVDERPASPALNLNYVLLGIGVVVLVAFLIRRSNTQAARSAVAYPAAPPPAAAPVGFGAQYAPQHGPGYAPGYTPGYGGAPAAGGSGIGGAVLGGVAGLAAGYALTKAFEGGHPGASTSASPAAPSAGGESGYVPFDAPAPPDLGGFDAGTGESWDAGDASGGGDDNW